MPSGRVDVLLRGGEDGTAQPGRVLARVGVSAPSLAVGSTATPGRVQAAAGTPTPAVSVVAEGITYGFNFSTSIFEWFGGAAPGTSPVSENGTQLVARLKSTFGIPRVPIMKAFPNNVPNAWSTTWDVCDGNRMIVCMKPNVSFANAAAGGDDSEFTAFCASVPTGKYVRVVLDNEPEARLAAGNYTAADFRATYARFKAIADAATVASGGAKKIELWTCFQVPFQTGYSITATTGNSYKVWLPRPNECHGLGWDGYGNKFGTPGPTGQIGDASSYNPSYETRFTDALAVSAALGHTRLGVPEMGAPPRTWDDGSWPASPWFSDGLLKGRHDYLRKAYDFLESVPGMEFVVFFDSFNKNNGSQDQRLIAGGRPTNGTGASSASPFPAFSHMAISPYPTTEPAAAELSSRILNNLNTAWAGGN